MIFSDRSHAGRLLADELIAHQDRKDALVLALPRGGVVVGGEIASRLHGPLDVLVVRKLGLPECPEMAIGAIAPDGVKILSDSAVHRYRVPTEDLAAVVAAEQAELQRRVQIYRQDRPHPDLHDKIVILVDDGLATGQTMAAAIAWVKSRKPKEIIVTVPVGAADTCRMLAKQVNQLICLDRPHGFFAVGAAYVDFQQVNDEEVIEALHKANGVWEAAGDISNHLASSSEA